MTNPSHYSSVHGNLNEHDPIDVHETLTRQTKEISKLGDLITKLLQT